MRIVVHTCVSTEHTRAECGPTAARRSRVLLRQDVDVRQRARYVVGWASDCRQHGARCALCAVCDSYDARAQVVVPGGIKSKILYNLFRREFAIDVYKRPLSCDAFSGFGVHNRAVHNAEVRACALCVLRACDSMCAPHRCATQRTTSCSR
jgi:hypothetical protein